MSREINSTNAATSAANTNLEARAQPIYVRISQILRHAISEGSIPKGVVILEGPVAKIVGSTRTPVRQALQELEQEGLVSRFSGRGYVVGPQIIDPKRINLTAAMLGVEAGDEPARKTLQWEAIYNEVERDIVHLSVFDKYRVNELELARRYKVGRLVARDVLLRLERLGLLEKDERLRWVIQPLDAIRISHLYELRWLLEPVGLHGAVGATPVAEIQEMIAGLKKAMAIYPKISRTGLDKLELDLHVALLSRCPNRDLLQSLERTRCLLTLSKHALGLSAPMPKQDPFMSEHLIIFEALTEGDVGQAEQLLRKHLEDSCSKLINRIDQIRANYAKPNLPYISER